MDISVNKFLPRFYQNAVLDALFNDNYRKLVVVLPRRAGKDLTMWNAAIRQCLLKKCTVLYCLNSYKHARRVIWDAIDMDGNKFLEYIPKELIARKNEQEMKITFVNGSILACVSAEEYETSIIGSNAYAIIFSEFSRIKNPVVVDFVRPIIAANGGWMAFISTPYGKNAFYHMYNNACKLQDWYTLKLGVSQIQHISEDILVQEKAQMPIELYDQEYERFPLGQKVLTYNESKSIEDVKVNDLVFTHTGRARKVTKIMSRPYNGKLIKIKSFGSSDPILCTPEHPIRIYNRTDQSYIWKLAKEITLQDKVVFPKAQFGDFEIISKELCLLLAWYICDGSTSKNGVTISVHQRKVERIVSLLRTLNLNYVLKKSDSLCVNIWIYSTQLADFFKINCGLVAENKFIPFDLISPYASEFFHELMMGDGCLFVSKRENKYSFITISETLAYQVQLLAHSINEGYAAGISVREPYETIIMGRKVSCKKSFQINITFEKVGSIGHNWLIRAKNSVAASIKSIEELDYEGIVYNLSVQHDESYLVNGRAVHNCSFERGVEGSIYGRYLDALREEGHVSHVPYDPMLMVHTAWDIGVGDATAILWFQTQDNGAVIRIIDSYSNNNLGLDHYAKVIQDKPYRYGKHFAPHDMKVREFAGGAIQRVFVGEKLGINFEVLPQHFVQDGIENVWGMFPKMWIDDRKCKGFINALENYYREWNEERQVHGIKPVHNFASNFCDALRYLCQAVPMTATGLSLSDFDAKLREARTTNQRNSYMKESVAFDQYNRW